MKTSSINFKELGIGWKILGIFFIAYILFFTFAIFMRTISLAFKEVFIEAAYPGFIIANIFMVLCCVAMVALLAMKNRGSIIALGLWFVPHTITIINLLENQGNIKELSYKYLFWVAAGPSIFIPIKFDPVVFQINIIGIAAILLVITIYKKTKAV